MVINLTDRPDPSLFILGAGKCGTTSLHHYIQQHPDVCLSEPKEPFYFDYYHEEGWDWYQRFFDHWKGESVVGEATPSYLHNHYVIPRLADAVEAPRFVVVLRNPVDRAYSHWWMMRMHSGPKEEQRGFLEAIEDNIAAITATPQLEPQAEERQRRREREGTARIERDYVEIGHYAKHLEAWFERFPREAFYILRSRDLKADPERATQEIWAFLRLDSFEGPLRTPLMNTRKTPAVKRARAVLQNTGIYNLWSSIPQGPRDRLKAVISTFSEGAPPMDLKAQELLIRHYAPWNERLGLLLDLETGPWER